MSLYNNHSKLFKLFKLFNFISVIFFIIILPFILKTSTTDYNNNQDYVLGIVSQMGVWGIFALSYNLLLGQTGLLSFGHSIYFGLGALITIHTLNKITTDMFYIPIALLPLVGGCTGGIIAILFGSISTRAGGTVFSMISMGLVELLSACALMMPNFFGGESGVSGNRVLNYNYNNYINYNNNYINYINYIINTINTTLNIDYSQPLQCYYFNIVWCFICTIAIYALTKTPLGRLANAVRDNTERLEFVGYNPHKVRYLMLIAAGFFAGIAGGLNAINFEIVTNSSISVLRSSEVLIATVIGGINVFIGPIIGAIIFIFFSVVLSTITKAWQLYFGILFITIVLFSPKGVAHLILEQYHLLSSGILFKKHNRENYKNNKNNKNNLNQSSFYLLYYYIGIIFCSLFLIVFSVAAIEIIYHHTLEYNNSPLWAIFGSQYYINTSTFNSLPFWLIALSIIILTIALKINIAYYKKYDPANHSNT